MQCSWSVILAMMVRDYLPEEVILEQRNEVQEPAIEDLGEGGLHSKQID